MAEGGIRFIVWLIISALTIVGLLITIRNGLGVDDAVTGGAALVSTGKTIGAFFKGPSRNPKVVYAPRTTVSYGSWWK